MRPGVLAILLLTFPGSGLAAGVNDGWDSFSRLCSTEMLPSWRAEVKHGHAWTTQSVENLRGLREMTDVTCPAYMTKRNDGAAIRAFVTKKAATVDVSPLVEKEGNRLLSFLEAEMRAQFEAFAPTDLDFQTTRCGQLMRETQARMKARLQQIKQTTAALAATCFKTNQSQDQAELQKALVRSASERKGAGAPAAVPAGPGQRKPSSTITGVDEDKAKRAK